MSDEEDVDHDVPSNVMSGPTLVRSALANADVHSNGYVPSRWRAVDETDVASDVIGFGSQWSSIEVFAEASIHVACSKDHQAARERAATKLSYTIICRVFDDAGIPDHSLQHAGPTALSAHHGASQMLIPCSHPNHKVYRGDCKGQYYPSRRLPLKVEHGSGEIWCDDCHDCYNAFEQDNPGGPGGTMNPVRF